MQCSKCKNKENIDNLDKPLCNSCFLKLVEKRIRKHIRTNKLISKNDNLIILDETSQYLITKILPHLPLKITKTTQPIEYFKNNELKSKARKLKSKIVIPWTMDHESHHFLKNFINNKKPIYLGEVKPFIKLLLPITDQEAQTFAKIKNLKYKPLKQDRYTQIFNFLETKYKSVHYSFASSVKEFAQNLDKIYKK